MVLYIHIHVHIYIEHIYICSIDTAFPLLGIYPRELKTGTDICYTHVPSSIIHKTKDGSNPSVYRWMNKLNVAR